MDLATIIGLVLCFALCIFGITYGNGFGVIGNFVDVPSILITFGGSFMCILASYSIPEYIAGLKSIILTFKTSTQDVSSVIKKIIELSNVARKEGLLSLEEAAAELDDPFM